MFASVWHVLHAQMGKSLLQSPGLAREHAEQDHVGHAATMLSFMSAATEPGLRGHVAPRARKGERRGGSAPPASAAHADW